MTTRLTTPTAPLRRWAADPTAVRKTVLDLLYHGQASHLGPSMSVVEMLIAMYSVVDVEAIRRRDPLRPRIIVSKGHCAAATYSVMAHVGLLPMELVKTYHQDGSWLAGHVSHGVPYVEHSTGALGHGLSVGGGCAIGLRVRGAGDVPVLVLLGDGELQEGAVWEALMFARHHGLTNLTPLIDNNRISSITRTAEVINLEPLRMRFEGFGFTVHEVDGHDVDAIVGALRTLHAARQLGVVICNTVKGRGVPFAEGQPIWHYRSLNEQDYRRALAHLDGEAGG